MNAEDFYEEFKAALKYLGPGWYGKKDIKVISRQGKVILSYKKRETVIPIGDQNG